MLATGLTFPRCLFRAVFPGSTLRSDLIVIGAVNEGPNVRMTVPPPRAPAGGVRARMACPAASASRAPAACASSPSAAEALGSVRYSVSPAP